MKKVSIDFVKEETATITGHRPRYLPWGYDESKQCCLNFCTDVRKIFKSVIENGIQYFLTGMAEGFDMIGTEILLELREIYEITIIAVIPCLAQEKLWTQFSQERYRKILSQCDETIILSDRYYDGCMRDRNRYMVNNSSVCIACHNGRASGTSQTVRFAKENGNKVLVINPQDYA